MINTKFLLTISLFAIGIVYYFIFPTNKIVNIILDEYITIGITIISIVVYQFFKRHLKGKLVYEFIPNTNYVPIKSTVLFFVIFEAIDFYTEDGLIGIISLWFMYWVFGVLIYFLTHNINFYKNYSAYKRVELEQ